MSEINYIGEHLWLGQIGHFAIVLAFVSALFSAYAFYQSLRTDNSWERWGKWSFIVHGVSIFTVIGLILFAMTSRYYEYDYVYRTVSDASPMHYLLAAFWADQEGSFLLWMFWHVILGWIFMVKGRSWTAPTLISLALIQVFLTSMLLGVFLPFTESDFKIGSNPFILVRDVFDAPIFTNADYLTLIEGRGLNPLLQNYWMTIHPPVLFLGFASLSIPFCMTIAGLSTDRHKELMSLLLKWALFAGFIFGLGILMGGAWAYEALTFGGYWAWDPVENSSLVPWLFLIAGIHTNVIAKATQFSFKTTYIYYILAFILVLYSTFLTRSGILGDTSVHAFTTMGLENQLLLFILFFLGLGIYKLITGAKNVPVKAKEEPVYSREFWMFVGALILCFSGLLMTASTSLPVYNKIVEIWNPDHIPLAIEDPVHHNNKYQLWIGVFIGLLSGLAILLRYHGANWNSYRKKYIKHIGATSLISLIGTLLIGRTLNMYAWQHNVFLFAGIFTIACNIDYIIFFIKRNTKMSGAAFSHLGFGILILGIMFSGLNKRTITASSFVQQDFAEGEAINRAIILIKDQPFFTSGYWINYKGDTLVDNLRKYELEFAKINNKEEVVDDFTTFPSAIYNRDFTKIEAFNPGTSRNLTYDVFTAAAPPPHLQDIEQAQAAEDSLKYLSHLVSPGMTFEEEQYFATVGSPIFNYDFRQGNHGDSTDYDLTVGIPIEITIKRTNEKINVTPGLGLKNALVFQFPAVIDQLGIKIKLPESSFAQIFTEEDKLEYEGLNLKDQGTANWKGYQIALNGFDRSGTFKNYTPQEGDIAIAANLTITTPDKQQITQNPVFILRNAQQYSIKDYNASTGLHIRFANIDPNTETMSFRIAKDNRTNDEIELLIADDVPRSDILIVEANIFPGINLVWLGCLLMLGGILLSLIARRKLA